MSFADNAAGLIRTVGEWVTYKRRTGESYDIATGVKSDTYTDYTIKASVRQYSPRQLSEYIKQGDREVRIAAADLPFTPTIVDRIIVNGVTCSVENVITRKPFNVAHLHILNVRG